MFGDSLDALRGLLKSTFPNVPKIYISTMPGRFDRPSFYITLATSDKEHLNRDMYQADITWQIVYFAPLDEKQHVNVFDQLQVSEQIIKALMDAMYLTGPNGTVYHIVETEGGPRDAEVYITVTLQTELTRPRPEYDLMNEINHEQEGS